MWLKCFTVYVFETHLSCVCYLRLINTDAFWTLIRIKENLNKYFSSVFVTCWQDRCSGREAETDPWNLCWSLRNLGIFPEGKNMVFNCSFIHSFGFFFLLAFSSPSSVVGFTFSPGGGMPFMRHVNTFTCTRVSCCTSFPVFLSSQCCTELQNLNDSISRDYQGCTSWSFAFHWYTFAGHESSFHGDIVENESFLFTLQFTYKGNVWLC